MNTNIENNLEDLIEYAIEHDRTVNIADVRGIFDDQVPDGKELVAVLQYLKDHAITISDLVLPASDTQTSENVEGIIPLTEKEKLWLDEYFRELDEMQLAIKDPAALFEALNNGSSEARDLISVYYMKAAADIAVKKNSAQILIQDLIQEANLFMLTLLSDPATAPKNESSLIDAIATGLDQAIEALAEENRHDSDIVNKVATLDKTIRELTEDEDGETVAYDVNDLAILMDMDMDEIKKILWLTGDDPKDDEDTE